MTHFAQLITSASSTQGKNPPKTAADLPLVRSAGADEGLRGAYIHIPFCFHKCHYCDFYSIVDKQDRQSAFAQRLAEEIAICGPLFTRRLETIFIGGGTPTLLAADLWKDVLFPAIHEHLPLGRRGEFTVEANPETLTPELADILVAGGVNRVSIGAQSFDVRHLKTLERWHEPASVVRSVRLLRSAGIENINLDLIFAIPGQTLDEWLTDLDAALALHPDHLSCYGLTYEPNTPMTARLKAGGFERVDEDIEAAMYEATIDRLAGAGLEHYEISNWARPGRQCRHNLLYWTNADWWPLGPSAAGHVSGVRWKNASRLGEYLDCGPLPPITNVEQLDKDARAGEELMLGLRLRQGIQISRLNELAGKGGNARRSAIDRRLREGLLEERDGSVRFSQRGLLLADMVLADLV